MAKTAKPAKKGARSGKSVLDEVSKLYGFMQKNRLETVEYSQGDTRVRLVRRRQPSVPVPVYAAAPQTEAQRRAKPQTQPAPDVQEGDVIASPLMGIFFRAPSPSSPPFIREGEAVKAGAVLCMVESMKVFNEVKAEFDCLIKKCLVENGKPVKPGEPLFVIERK
ncbi:MAG: hypothetical protein PHP45_11300 [Elusimicrobiales bacterium]|nr:hypothetical protein [Elusimicrobiales bacterium]